MKAFIFGAAPQSAEPISKTNTAIINAHFTSNILNHWPQGRIVAVPQSEYASAHHGKSSGCPNLLTMTYEDRQLRFMIVPQSFHTGDTTEIMLLSREYLIVFVSIQWTELFHSCSYRRVQQTTQRTKSHHLKLFSCFGASSAGALPAFSGPFVAVSTLPLTSATAPTSVFSVDMMISLLSGRLRI